MLIASTTLFPPCVDDWIGEDNPKIRRVANCSQLPPSATQLVASQHFAAIAGPTNYSALISPASLVLWDGLSTKCDTIVSTMDVKIFGQKYFLC